MNYNAGEVFQYAIQIEKNGEKFYRELSKKIENEKAKDVFNILADDEIKHKETFEKILSSFEDYQPIESFPEEYFYYLKTFSENLIFSPEQVKNQTDDLSNPVKACEFGMRREVDSILYYYEIREMVVEKDKTLIDEIIKEEKKHYVKLADLRKTFV